MEHYDTLFTKYTLANVYLSQRRYDAAAALFQQVLHALERNHGAQHPDTLETMSALAHVYISQNHDAEAEKLLQVVHVLVGDEEVHGLSDPGTQRTIKIPLSVSEKLGRVDEARLLQRMPPSS